MLSKKLIKKVLSTISAVGTAFLSHKTYDNVIKVKIVPAADIFYVQAED